MPDSADVQCLIVVDMQRAFVEGGEAVPSKQSLVAAVNEQLENARNAGVFVVHLQNDGAQGMKDEPLTWGWELSIEPLPTETVIRKKDDSGFVNTDLDALLQEHNIEAISVCGVMSEMCVAATARAAMEHGYDVVVAHDSHATYPVPPYLPGEPEVPAAHSARAAEWSLGDTVIIPPRATNVRFRVPRTS